MGLDYNIFIVNEETYVIFVETYVSEISTLRK